MMERRKCIRHNLNYRVLYAPSEAPEKKMRAASFNLSMEGIGIDIKNFITESEKVNLEIFIPRVKSPIKAKGRLAWQAHLPSLGAKRCGIQFTEIPWTRLKTILGNPA